MSESQNSIYATAKKIGHHLKAYYRFNESIKNYSNHVKECRKEVGSRKKIVFLVVFPEAWNSLKSIYSDAMRRTDVDVYLVAAPRDISKYAEDIDIRTMQNDAYDFFVESGIEAIKANSEKDWFDIKNLNPDYVIYTRPYIPYYPEEYRSYNVCAYAKVIYIPYAYSMLSDGLTVLPEDFILSTHKVYLANESRKYECEQYYPRYIRENNKRFEYLGFPRFDLLIDDKKADDNAKFTMAWLPRWTTGEGYKNNKGTHFLTYYKEFLEYAQKHDDVNLIIRPHPSMFTNFVEKGIMTEDEVNNFKLECQKCGNVFIDQKKDYFDTIKAADALVADYTSLIAEYFMTGKPIVYCDTADGLNPEGNTICSNLYRADSFDEIITQMEKIKNGSDDEKNHREKLIKELLPAGCGNIGREILESIINS
ncbi:CDP-glycerol glycerophosphotransferase family protein [Butyrivibrio sp. YAB3001]|uniref:CDP-glycerol glycerophosphotransferase family protein n=1 Tax=Butyrivibrio sp. YAB3001 TaxID=1520812 RepID=UPI0008F67308|nr:CDP-glycerol glycerophosphotransferase family protein [Butyrivibrio sp. YAB3001]SFC62292.1 CDP-Glycerol:Poly(glycerophosphate) glycerophosphotransferase [Butyrivibrio sp. YAB3001]